MTQWTDIGHGVRIEFTGHAEYERVGLLVEHPRGDGGWYAQHPPEDPSEPCMSSALFDLSHVREHFPDQNFWTVESFEPLTLSPSLLCRLCGHHGFIREGRWIPA